MAHQNRNWQRRWTVDFEQQTATHEDGWVFKFVKGEESGEVFFDGKLIKQPKNLTPEQILNASRIAQEAGEAWQRARKARQ
ncbi:hypothetical protein PL75_03115 [Neisseria arctica]|uniref:Uncharacterized protein n=1 Tax=Neisseria arctica TaxID=1470200 RepID=A0A0J0YT02_9NEIS|nr:hypothetical protein [Neisseria arctica]KLT73237.1 hypothetical protein PL75_03115 [Neisseria arctica]UOO87516.1 hypothetical protein LVJ86_04525 [Neisseria arctica]